jgi:hypothetical protein
MERMDHLGTAGSELPYSSRAETAAFPETAISLRPSGMMLRSVKKLHHPKNASRFKITSATLSINK